jgi:putrescine importer
VVTTILIAMVAMLFTAISYGRMARAYPSAGSAFTYVGQEINPALGYVTGWSMVMDYMLNPMICTIWCSQQAHVFAPGVPYAAWAVFFALVFTLLNVQGVKTSARVNSALAAGWAWSSQSSLWSRRATFSEIRTTAQASILGPSTTRRCGTRRPCLAEPRLPCSPTSASTASPRSRKKRKIPRRNILLATVLTCLVIGILSAVEVYAAQLIWPASQPFPTLTPRSFTSPAAPGSRCSASSDSPCWSPTSDPAWARRSALPACSTAWDAATRCRNRFSEWWTRSIACRAITCLFVGAIALIGAFVMSYGLGAEMLNFGALIAFMGVNAAAFMRYVVRDQKWTLSFVVPPVLGFVICFVALAESQQARQDRWHHLDGCGIAFGAWKTRGFRGDLVNFDLPAEDENKSQR